MRFPIDARDRQLEYFDCFDRRLRTMLRALITDDLIEEHRVRPCGQHSDPLERVLNYFRRAPVAGKLAVLNVGHSTPAYGLASFSGSRGAAPVINKDPVYDTLNEALHAVFLLRVADLMQADLEYAQ